MLPTENIPQQPTVPEEIEIKIKISKDLWQNFYLKAIEEKYNAEEKCHQLIVEALQNYILPTH